MDVNQSEFGINSLATSLAVEPGFVACTDIKSAYVLNYVFHYSIDAINALNLQSARMGAEKERELVLQAQQGSDAALAELLESFTPFIASVVKQYKGRGVYYNDLVNSGSLGFIEAIMTYEPGFNTRLSTWSYYSIKKEAASLIEGSQFIKVPRRKIALLCEIKRRFEEGEKANSIARDLSLSTEAVFEIYDEAQNVVESLDSVVYDTEEGSRYEQVSYQKDESAEALVISDEALKQLDQFLSQLTPWECLLICMRTGTRGYSQPSTLEAVAKELNKLGMQQNGREWSKELVRVKQVQIFEKLSRLAVNHERGVLSASQEIDEGLGEEFNGVSMFASADKVEKSPSNDADEGYVARPSNRI
ncbi:hypothetical protein OAT84_00065 [Gammaproteobacteria bacterium]|nr:hypothetical protein [Gammaproteobacteria bacterium]